MLIAIERSTAFGSAALFSEEGVLVFSVSDSHGAHGDAYGLVASLLEKSGVPVSEITRFAVGIGPGSFSGIRSAIAVLGGLALPVGGKVEGVSSAAAADAVFRKDHPEAEEVAVVGDARRGHLWISLFGNGSPTRNTIEDFRLVDRADVASFIPCHAAVVTPDRERLSPLLATAFPPERVHFINPTAEAVGRLTFSGCSALALPIYLHPAVMPPA